MQCPGPETVVAYLQGSRRATTQDSIEAHIDRCPSCRTLVAVMVASGAAEPRADAPPAPTPSDLGLVGRYVLRSIVGVGAMGIVYRAHDPTLDREVALKVLRCTETERAAGDLLAEAKALAAIEHPNVVAVFAVGTHEGAVFLAMELVRGETLREWIQRRSPTPAETLARLADAARGLAAIHDAGLLHCDIKPDNVLVGEDDRVLVADLGLAAQLGRPRAPATAASGSGGSLDITRSALLVGTPVYMAPELLDGEAPTPASDLYSLCATAFELLHGARPFAGSTIDELRLAIVEGRIEVERRAEVPRAVRETIERGLVADPSLRPRMDALVVALEARAPSRRAPLIALGVVALGAVAWLAMPSSEAPSVIESDACPLDVDAADQLLQRARQPELATAITTDRPSARGAQAQLHRGLERWARTWGAQADEACDVRARDEAAFVARRRCLAQERAEVEGLLAAIKEPDSAGGVIDHLLRLGPPACEHTSQSPVGQPQREQLARIRVDNWAARHDEAAAAARRLLDDPAVLEDTSFGAAVRSELGHAMIGRGEVEAGIDLLQRAVLDARAAGDDARVAEEGAALVVAMVGHGRADESAQWLRHAEAAVERAGGAHARALVDYAAGVLAHRSRDFDTARQRYAAALAVQEELFGPDGLGVFDVLDAMTRLHFDEGQLDEARDGCERVLEIARAAWGLEHPRAAGTLANLTPILATTGQADRARKLLERSQRVLVERFGPTHPKVGLGHMQLGVLAATTGDMDAAAEHLGACVDAYGREPTDPNGIACRLNLAELYLLTGECDEALVHYSGLVQAFEAAAIEDEYARELAIALYGEARCRLEAQPQAAVELLERVEVLAPTIGDPLLLEQATFERARALSKLGQRTDALALARGLVERLGLPLGEEVDPELVLVGDREQLRSEVEVWIADQRR